MVDLVFPGAEGARQFLVDTGADLSVAPRYLAEETGLSWADGTPSTMRGVSPRTECKVEGRVLDAELFVSPAGWRLMVPVFFAEADVPMLAGRKGFLDRMQLTVHGRRRTVRLVLL